jgi:hypothetical protein
MRKGRISITYEGTNAVQALDFLDRKILPDQDVKLRQWSKRIKVFIDVHKKSYPLLNSGFQFFERPLNALLQLTVGQNRQT